MTRKVVMAEKKVFRTHMNGNMLDGSSAGKIDTCFEIPMKINKSRLLFLTGDMDDMEVDPGIHSPSPGSRSPIKKELQISETHSLKYKKSILSTQNNEVTPIRGQRHPTFFSEESKTTDYMKIEEIKIEINDNT